MSPHCSRELRLTPMAIAWASSLTDKLPLTNGKSHVAADKAAKEQKKPDSSSGIVRRKPQRGMKRNVRLADDEVRNATGRRELSK